MTNFDYAFTLIGLILGLSVAEILTGLVRTIRAHELGKSGWLTPYLGAIVICDLTTFWGLLGEFRDSMPTLFQALGAGVLVTGIYYAASSLVFPDEGDADLDAHYFRNKKLVLSLVILCNLIVFAGLFRGWTEAKPYLISGGWLALAGLALMVRGKMLNYVALTGLLVFYAFVFLLAGY